MFHHRVFWAVRLLWVAVTLMVLGVMFSGPSLASGDDAPRLQVVASFSVLGDMAKEIGGRHVNVVTIVGPNADTHSFEPAPQSIQVLATAQVLVENGLGFETWLSRLVDSSGFDGVRVLASKGVRLRQLVPSHDGAATPHSHTGDNVNVDPHAWQSLQNGIVYARNIADGLAQADPDHAADYQRRAKKYVAKMEMLDIEVRAALDTIPVAHRKAITPHDAFGYFGDAYGIEFIPVAGVAADAEPSAQEVAALVDRVRQKARIGVFTEKTSNPKLVEQLAREADIVVGGPLFPDALDFPDEPAGTYLGMFHWNAGQLISTLKSEEAVAVD